MNNRVVVRFLDNPQHTNPIKQGNWSLTSNAAQTQLLYKHCPIANWYSETGKVEIIKYSIVECGFEWPTYYAIDKVQTLIKKTYQIERI